MYNTDYHESITHKTGSFPLAFYHVDPTFPRYRMTMHWHNEVELIRVLSGSIRLFLDETEYNAEAGDFLSIASGVIHGGEPADCVYECIVFDLQALTPGVRSCLEVCERISHTSQLIKNCQIETDIDMKNALYGLFDAASRDFRDSSALMLSRIQAVMHYLSAQITKAREESSVVHSLNHVEQLKPALEYISNNYGQHITLETLASLSGFSPNYFCRYFRSVVHRSPIDYLNYYRIERAAEFLVRKGMNVAETAALCGFSDSSAFIKQFRHYKGSTPKQFQLRSEESDNSGS